MSVISSFILKRLVYDIFKFSSLWYILTNSYIWIYVRTELVQIFVLFTTHFSLIRHSSFLFLNVTLAVFNCFPNRICSHKYHYSFCLIYPFWLGNPQGGSAPMTHQNSQIVWNAKCTCPISAILTVVGYQAPLGPNISKAFRCGPWFLWQTLRGKWALTVCTILEEEVHCPDGRNGMRNFKILFTAKESIDINFAWKSQS